MSRFVPVAADGRVFGLDRGDWLVLLGGGLIVLAFLLTSRRRGWSSVADKASPDNSEEGKASEESAKGEDEADQ